jgi:pimeloyl-ACP methyl ester carboxylesterase
MRSASSVRQSAEGRPHSPVLFGLRARSPRRITSIGGVAGIAVGIVVACLFLASPAPAGAALEFRECRGGFLFSCARLSVPVDRSGTVSGRVSLLIKRMESGGRRPRAPVFLLAGGPGQSATAVYASEQLFSPVDAFLGLRRRDLIVFDQRGTGGSGLLRCPRLEHSGLRGLSAAAADCAARLGVRRHFYTTRDSVEDIEAIRAALGSRRIALVGTSYGTKVALAYASRYPQRVERLVLDSTVPASGVDPFLLDTFAAIPRVLGAVCGRDCRRFTPDATRDMERLAARLARGPLRGHVYATRGRIRRTRLTRSELLALLLAPTTDLSAVPADVHSAVVGDPAPLLRQKRRTDRIPSPSPRELSGAVFAATICEEGRLPWAPAAPIAAREREAAASASALPGSAFRPFDRETALANVLLRTCRRWPAPLRGPASSADSFPDIPVLLLAGELDLLTPFEDARRVAALFPRAQLRVAPDIGHSVLGSDPLGCGPELVERFFAGRSLPLCPAVPTLPSQPVPTSLSEVGRARRARGLAGRAITAVRLTVDDVLADALGRLFFGDPRKLVRLRMVHGGGLRGGGYAVHLRRNRLRLRRVVFVPGVRVSGVIHRVGERKQRGRLRVSGPSTPDGTLVLHGNRVRGRLGGRRLRARMFLGLAASASSNRREAGTSGLIRPSPHRPPDLAPAWLWPPG